MSLYRIVIVDDDSSVRNLLRMTLPVEGVEVVEAGDGREALELIRERAPDLVVLDWRMPHHSGADVLAELKRRRPELPVIVLTADADLPSRVQAEALRADSFLTKPFSPLELLDTVERLLPSPWISAPAVPGDPPA